LNGKFPLNEEPLTVLRLVLQANLTPSLSNRLYLNPAKLSFADEARHRDVSLAYQPVSNRTFRHHGKPLPNQKLAYTRGKTD